MGVGVVPAGGRVRPYQASRPGGLWRFKGARTPVAPQFIQARAQVVVYGVVVGLSAGPFQNTRAPVPPAQIEEHHPGCNSRTGRPVLSSQRSGRHTVLEPVVSVQAWRQHARARGVG